MSKRARLNAENASATFTSLRGLITPVESGEETATGQVIEVELARLRPNPDQPRRSSSAGMSKSSIEDLAANIREHGLLNPIIVKDTGRFYQIVAGERRFLACQRLGLERVPVRVVEPRDEQEELQISLAENLQRKNLGALEEALAFRTLIERFGLSYRDLAKLSGRSVAHVHGRLQLLDHDDVRQAVQEKRIGIADAIQLARVPDEAQRKELLQAVQEGALRGASLHRQVQVFLGEISPEAARNQQDASPGDGEPQGLGAALATVESLGPELSEEDQRLLYTLAARAAERLNLNLVAAESPKPEPPKPESQPVPTRPALDPEARRVIARTKEHRGPRGYTLVNLIRAYWMNMERRGYVFSPGEWRAAPAGPDRYLVSFSYRVDQEARTMEWWYNADGSLEPANEDAESLLG